MILLESAINGIRNFKQPLRLHFKSGLNLIQGGNGSGKTTFCDTFFALLSLTPSSRARFDDGQAGFLIQLKDGGVYRFVRNFAKQKSSLGQLGPDNKFKPITQDEAQILKFLTDQAGGLEASELEAIFSLKRSWMPSSLRSTHLESIGPSRQPTKSEVQPTSSENRLKKQKRLEEIRTLLAQSDQLAKKEDQVADLQARSAELKRRLRIYQEKTDELERLKRQDRWFEALLPLPEHHLQLFDQYEHQQTTHADQIQLLEEDKAQSQTALGQIVTQPIFLNRFFLAGGALVIMSFMLPLAVELSGPVQSAFLLPLLVGVGLMAFAAIGDFARINKRKTLQSQLRDLLKRRDAIESAFRTQTAPVQELLKRTNCNTLQALRDKVRDYEQFIVLKQEIETERARILAGKTTEELENELSALGDRLKGLESEIRSDAHLTMDLYSLQEEMRKLEQELSQSTTEVSQPSMSLHGSDSSDRSDFLLPEPLRYLLSHHPVRSLLLAESDQLQTEIHRWLARFPQTQSLILIMDEELIPVISTQQKQVVKPAELSAGLLDQVYFAFFIALTQLLAESHPFPLILDDPLGSLDAANQAIALDILREIAQNRQVLLFSNQSYPSQVNDGVMILPSQGN